MAEHNGETYIFNALSDSEKARLRGRSVADNKAEAREAQQELRKILSAGTVDQDTVDFEKARKELKLEGTAAELKNKAAELRGLIEGINETNADKMEVQGFQSAAKTPIVGDTPLQRVATLGQPQNLFDIMENKHGSEQFKDFLCANGPRSYTIPSASFRDIQMATMTRGGGEASPFTGTRANRPINVEDPAYAVPHRTGFTDIVPKIMATNGDQHKFRREVNAGSPFAGSGAFGNYSTAEDAASPTQDFGTEEVTLSYETCRAIGQISEEQAADVPQARDIASNQLSNRYRENAEWLSLNGNGTSPQMRGLLNTADILPNSAKPSTGTLVLLLDHYLNAIEEYERARAADDNDDRGAGTSPSHILMRPQEHRRLMKAKSTQNEYLYAMPSEMAPSNIWAVPIVLSDAMPQYEAVLWNNSSDYLYMVERTGVSIEMGWNGEDFNHYRRSIRIVGRKVLVVVRPTTIKRVTGLNNADPSSS